MSEEKLKYLWEPILKEYTPYEADYVLDQLIWKLEELGGIENLLNGDGDDGDSPEPPS